MICTQCWRSNDVSLAVWLRWTKKQGGDYLLRVTVELAKICKLVRFFVDSAARTDPVDSLLKKRQCHRLLRC